MTVGNVIANKEIKASDVINATMAGLSFTGFGSLIAGSYFLVDLGSQVFTGKSLGEHIDGAVGGPIVSFK